MPTYHAIFLKEIPEDEEYCMESMAEEIEEQISDIDYFQELFESNDKDGEMCFRFSFAFEIGEDLRMPRGSHPHSCQADCSYCYALEGYQEALEREDEKITEEITEELVKVEGFDRLEFIND